jgi:CheY-like chemotaxis protein
LSVPLAEQEAIFDEFRQSERTVARGYGGLGIGLAICRQLVEMHGGRIGVRSSGEENQGSTFYFSLPLLPSPAPIRKATTSPVVLILTEEAQSSLPVRIYLEQQGFQVQTLQTTSKTNWQADLLAKTIGALVLDFKEPKLGWEILETIKDNPATQDIPIIFYSLLQEQDRGSMLPLDYLSKPEVATSLPIILERYGIDADRSKLPRNVLIVDDEENIRDLHTRLVIERLPDCQVQCASNGKEALVYMQTWRPDLVLLDLKMPEVNGLRC